MADLESDVEFGEILLILVIFLFVGYLIYKGFGSLADLLKNFHLPKLSDLFSFKTGGNVVDSGTGISQSGNADRAGQGDGTADANIKLEINRGGPCGVMTPATAAGANSNCGGAQANCCTGNGCECQ